MSNIDTTIKHCKHCGRHTTANRKGTNNMLHLLLSIITFGVWIIVWILASIKIGGWVCAD